MTRGAVKRYTSRNTGHVWTARGHGYYLFCSACGAVAWALLIDGRWRAWAFATVADTARKLPSCRGRVLQEERDRHVDFFRQSTDGPCAGRPAC